MLLLPGCQALSRRARTHRHEFAWRRGPFLVVFMSLRIDYDVLGDVMPEGITESLDTLTEVGKPAFGRPRSVVPQPWESGITIGSAARDGGPFARLAEDVRTGLTRIPKELPPKYFYD